MNCPICGGSTRVRDSRTDCETVVRRRKCTECGHNFFTTETELDESRIEFYRIRDEVTKRSPTRRYEREYY